MRLSATTRKFLHLVALPLALAGIATFGSYRIIEQDSSLASLVDVLDTQRANALRGDVPPNPLIELITFDEKTLQKMGFDPAGPMPRAKHAELITALDKAGARVALYDVKFGGDRPGTAALKSALDQLRNMCVTLPTRVEENSQLDPNAPIISGPMDKIAVSGDYDSDRVRVAQVESARSDLGEVGFGAIPIMLDTSTNKTILYGPISAALQYYGIPKSSVYQDVAHGRVTAGSLEWNIDEGKTVGVRWTDTVAPFPRWDFQDALNRLKTDAGRQAFRGKIVIIGDYRPGDSIETKRFGQVQGVDWIAQMMNTVLLGSSAQIVRTPDTLFYGIGILVCFAGFLALRHRKPVVGLAVVVLLVGACFLVQRWFGFSFGWRFGTTGPIFALIATSLCALLMGRYWTDDLNLSRTREPEDATVLFYDLRSSTVLLHEIGSERFQRMFSELMASCGPIVAANGGEIEHMLGDGFMAIFRADGRRHHALRCADTCEKLIQATSALAEEESLPLKASLGFESGMIGGGYVHEGEKKSWSSTGTTIHLAQRLQALCGQLDMRVAVGPVARRLIANERSCELITKAYVKGFADEVEVCSLR